jgi:hypothetical protein
MGTHFRGARDLVCGDDVTGKLEAAMWLNAGLWKMVISEGQTMVAKIYLLGCTRHM